MARLSADERRILSMFRYKRPQGSVVEDSFVEAYLAPLGFKRDAYENLALTVGENPEILFSSHLDTVHSTQGFQNLDYRDGILQLTKRERSGRSNCLGADDTAGIWLMLEMIKAGVPGFYIIHHGEESGCIGSSDLAKNEPDFLSQFSKAVAFDRMGRSSVITHQMGRRCCSEAFARSLSAALGGAYSPDDSGSYTDTNEYKHLIPECTNISVGYRGQHSSRETQDVPFLISLRDRLVKLDWSKLAVERDPSQDEFEDDDFGYRGYGAGYGTYKGRSHYRASTGHASMADLCRQYPEVVAELLEGFGVDQQNVMDHVSYYYGDIFGGDNDHVERAA